MKQIAIIAIIFIAALSLHQVNKERQEERTANIPTQEWCEVGQVMSDGSIVYNGSAGTTELVAFATVSGLKLMAKCK